jgi:hypothetical protein
MTIAFKGSAAIAINTARQRNAFFTSVALPKVLKSNNKASKLKSQSTS